MKNQVKKSIDKYNTNTITITNVNNELKNQSKIYIIVCIIDISTASIII